MPAKGQTNNPKGRPAGIPNKTTTDFKKAINNLVEYATPEMVSWLKQVAEEDPAKALDLLHKLAEFAYPKLARTELANADDKAFKIEATDVTSKVLKELPEERLQALLDEHKNNNG